MLDLLISSPLMLDCAQIAADFSHQAHLFGEFPHKASFETLSEGDMSARQKGIQSSFAARNQHVFVDDDHSTHQRMNMGG